MKIKNVWKGFNINVSVKDGNPLFERKEFAFPGADGRGHVPKDAKDETKILSDYDTININGINISTGGFEMEIEVSVEEMVQQVKNIKEIAALLRSEVKEWVVLGLEIKETYDTVCKPTDDVFGPADNNGEAIAFLAQETKLTEEGINTVKPPSLSEMAAIAINSVKVKFQNRN
jgi:hypothetical protein